MQCQPARNVAKLAREHAELAIQWSDALDGANYDEARKLRLRLDYARVRVERAQREADRLQAGTFGALAS